MSGIWQSVKEGDERSFVLERASRSHFVRYAGASGDFNAIHFDQTFAEKAGLPTVFGQGMFTAGTLARVPTEWFGATSVKRYAVRFSSRIWPDDNVTFAGTVARVYQENGVPHADLELTATNQKGEVLIAAESTVREWLPR